MTAPKSKTGVHDDVTRRVRSAGRLAASTTVFIGPDHLMPKGTAGIKLKVPDTASRVLTSSPKSMKVLLLGYSAAIAESVTAGRQVSFRVDVDPEGVTVVTPFEEAVAAFEPIAKDASARNSELEVALAAARKRGRLRAADILDRAEMLNADELAKRLGISRVTVNTKRQNGLILGLDGAKRGFRFPEWQLDAEDKPYVELAVLHERLGGPWAVYRFLVQPHGELNGLTGREALERGKGKAAIEAAESVGRDFR
jgi:hypothetical protein